MRKLSILLRFTLLNFLLVAGSLAHAQAPDARLLTYQGPDRMARLAAAAKKEGALTIYTTIAEKDLPTLLKPFEAKYGIKVKVWRSGTDKVLQRTLAETNAKRYEVDVIHFGSPEMEALHREKILQPVNSVAFADLVDGAVPKHREWAVTLLSVWVQAYNTNLVTPADLPKSYKDLLDPKWKGKLAIEAKNQDWFAEAVRAVGSEAAGLKLFSEIVAKNGISLRKGHTLLTNMVVSGEVPMALTLYNYMPEQAKRKGAPIDWFAIEPAITRTNAVGIAKHAPHPNAAALFYEFMLTEAQALLVSMDYVPSNKKFESPLKSLKLKLVDPGIALDEQAKWEKLFEETMKAN